MSGFLVTNKNINDNNLEKVNFFLKKRGPDETTFSNYDDLSIIFNLNNISNNICRYPFIRDNILILLDGEVFNYRDIYKESNSCCESIFHNYKNKRKNFLNGIDGEYAIVLVDFNKNLIYATTDLFETKPLYISIQDESFGISSLPSALKALGFKKIKNFRSNCALEFNLKNKKIQDMYSYYKFDINNEHKKHFEDWHIAFENAVKKRVSSLLPTSNICLSLSEGYDSGAVAASFKKFDISCFYFSYITQLNNPEVLNYRHDIDTNLPLNKNGELFISPNFKNKKLIPIDDKTFNISKALYKSLNESFYYITYLNNGTLVKRKGDNHFMTFIYYSFYNFIKNNKIKVGFTGISGDGVAYPNVNEIIKKYNSILPIANGGAGSNLQASIIFGNLGVESRSPFTDPALLQESLWMDKSVYRNENNNLKAPIHDYLEKEKFPFYSRDKTGKLKHEKYGFGNYLNFNILCD